MPAHAAARDVGEDQLPAVLRALSAPGRHDRHGARGSARAVVDLRARLRADPESASEPAARSAACASTRTRRRAGAPCCERIEELHRAGRPVLVGTNSIAASEQLSRMLDAAGLPHRVLNARQDADEAAIVAEAGQLARITVATSMAGRGTDIRLGAGVAELGGLHVLATQRAAAARIDRQLSGRCARQGDPGSCELLLSVEDLPSWARAGCIICKTATGRLPSRVGPLAHVDPPVFRRAAEQPGCGAELILAEESREDLLAFSGSGE